MVSLIGAHFTKNGIKQLPSRVVLSLNGVGIGGDETHGDTLVILRDTRVFDNGETTSDFHTFDPVGTGISWEQYGNHWYSERTEKGGNFKAAWALNPTANLKQIQNEQGGGGTDEFAMQRNVDIERAICWAANEDGHKCGILNLAGGSPDFESWKRIYVPFIMEAWEHGQNPYCRHCYADKFVNDDGSIVPGQPARVIAELEYLRSIGYGGGMVLTECGLFGGYGVAEYSYFEQQVTRWEAALRPYADMFMGLCFWELGASEFNADYTAHLKQLLPYIEAGSLPRWTPPTPPPDGGEEPMPTIQIGNNHGGYLTHLGTGEKTLKLTPGYFDGRTFIPTGEATEIELSNDARALHYVSLGTKDVECPEEPVNPNPPPVALTLPRGSKGVDVSYWQGSFNWADSGAEFGIIRCSDGMTANTSTHDGNGIDRQFFANAAKLTALGIPWAIYHFLRPGSIQAQTDKVLSVLQSLADLGQSPQTAVFDNGVKLPAVFIDVEDGALTNAHVQEFYNLLFAKHHVGIYTGKPIWELITSGAAVWWANVPLWIAAYGVNDGNIPPWPDGPFLPRGWQTAVLWQYSSNPIDKNIVGPYPPTAVQPPPPPPPTGATYNTSFMRGEPGIWRVIRRPDGSGQDVWEYRIDSQNDARVKNGGAGKPLNEWQAEFYYYAPDGSIWRILDTSPAAQSDGTERLYIFTEGGQIAPANAVVGVTYSFPNVVQFKAKSDCRDLSENSGPSTSTFLLKAVIDNYKFPGTGFVVDRFYWTVQTGENQFYVEHDGRRYGWCGGGANQPNNIWAGELAEVYYDRAIPNQEPPRFCE